MSIKGKDTELKHFTTFLIFEINLKWNLTEIRVIIIFFLNFSNVYTLIAIKHRFLFKSIIVLLSSFTSKCQITRLCC